jgi:hypothetical protein
VLEDLGRPAGVKSESQYFPRAVALHLIIQLDPAEDLPQAGGLWGQGTDRRPDPGSRHYLFSTVTTTTTLLSVLGSTRARVPPSGVPGTWGS